MSERFVVIPGTSGHGKKRMRERAGIGGGTASRAAQKAYDCGFRRCETKGSLEKRLKSLYGRVEVHTVRAEGIFRCVK